MKLNKFNQYLLDNWQGKQPLWVPFWLHGFGMGTLLGAFFTTILLERLTLVTRISGSVTLDNFTGAALLIYATVALLGFWFTYYIWNLVSTWRCAANSGAIVCWLARLFTVGVFVTYWGLVLRFSWGILG